MNETEGNFDKSAKDKWIINFSIHFIISWDLSQLYDMGLTCADPPTNKNKILQYSKCNAFHL